ncbi:MAG: hypothetical protein HYX46_09975 [Betaproteobacteria bacterium]|nr:hypothetical protein [Betaproteobacteria bacterium]
MDSLLRRIILVMAVCTFPVLMADAAAQSKDLTLGTWKLNVEKSKFSPGPAPKSLTVMIEASGKGRHVTTEAINADGSRTGTEYTAYYDGKDYPLKGSIIADTVSMKRINARTFVRTDKKNGKTMSTFKIAVAKDGKTYTVDVKSVTPKGEPVKNFLVFEKQ